MIFQYADYHRATNAAYRLLYDLVLEDEDIRMETDIYNIVKKLKIVSIHSYTEICNKNHCDRSLLTSNSDHGFVITRRQTNDLHYMICVNDEKGEGTVRFTIAHEIGHIILKHFEDNSVTDKEANCFARNLLCPVYIRNALKLKTISDYQAVFNITESMAQVVIDKNSLDFYHIDNEIYCEMEYIFQFMIHGYTLQEAYGF